MRVCRRPTFVFTLPSRSRIEIRPRTFLRAVPLAAATPLTVLGIQPWRMGPS